jgi:serine protease Do
MPYFTKWTWVALAVLIAIQPAPARSPILREIEDSFVRLHEAVGPCVVSIETEGRTEGGQQGFDDLQRFFGVPRPENPGESGPTQFTGSGFIYDLEGHIVTNNHVIADAKEIRVLLANGNRYEAEVVGADPDTDLAVIKIDAAEPFTLAVLGDSDSLKVGQFAIAMGSPRGFEGSLSFGHISALGRNNLWGLEEQGVRFQNLIQTDAAINLGNSGGPLCNIDGEVIGINIAIIWGANSIGFAIPVNEIKNIVPDLIVDGKVTRGFLGVEIDEVDADLASALELPDENGALVKEVRANSPASRDGIHVYDVIRRVNGEVVEDVIGLIRKISSLSPDETIMIELWRGEESIELQTTLDEWDAGRQIPQRALPVLGMQLHAVTAEIRKKLALNEDDGGLIVTELVPGSPADEAGIEIGDRIIEAAQLPISSLEGFRSLVNERAGGNKSILVRYVRADASPDITVIKVP